MQTERCDGYKVRGLQEQRGAGWRIATWLEGKDEPAKEYWVKDEVFYKPKNNIAPGRTERQKVSAGSVDVNVDPAEKKAVLTLIRKWDAQIPPAGAGA